MRMLRVATIGLAIGLSAASGLAAQPVTGHKSPAVGGLLSAAIPGMGSYYAGDEAHGTRHFAIAGLTALGVVAGASQCDIPFGEDDGCEIAAISALAFVGNWVWSIVVGVDDARDYNRLLDTAGLHVATALIPLASGGDETVGLRVMRFTF